MHPSRKPEALRWHLPMSQELGQGLNSLVVPWRAPDGGYGRARKTAITKRRDENSWGVPYSALGSGYVPLHAMRGLAWPQCSSCA